jgi:hypothetical protein
VITAHSVIMPDTTLFIMASDRLSKLDKLNDKIQKIKE